MFKSISFIITAICVLIVLTFAFLLGTLTFNNFRGSMGDAVRTQTMELSTQIVYNYENYIRGIINTSVTIQAEISMVQSFDDWNDVSAFFNDVLRLNNDILKIAVFDYETRVCLASSDLYEMGSFLYADAVWFYEALENPTVHVFSGPYSGDGVYRVNVSRSIGLPDGRRGVLKIEISFQRFIELVMKSNLGDGGHITIIDQNYNIVYTSLEWDIDAVQGLAAMRTLVLGTKSAEVNGYNMFVTVDTLSNTKWRIGVFINADKLSEIEQGFIQTTIIILIIVLVIGIFIFTWVGKAITGSLRRLEFAMRTVEKSDYFRMEEVNESAFKEVSALNLRFNKMMQKINELMHRVMDEQEAQRKSELKALQNQINPHFLYNTLESIIWVIEKEKNLEASQMVASLARLFRFGLSTDDETVPLRNEIEHVRNYLQIQKFRYSDTFDYEIDVDEKALDIKTMKLILQPIVENSLYHGIKNNIDRGYIKISGHIDGDFLVLSVSDNGYGMRQEKIDMLYSSFKQNTPDSGVGLKNIYQRVMIYYGGNAEMLIESELDEGTTITIKEPINEK